MLALCSLPAAISRSNGVLTSLHSETLAALEHDPNLLPHTPPYSDASYHAATLDTLDELGSADFLTHAPAAQSTPFVALGAEPSPSPSPEPSPLPSPSPFPKPPKRDGLCNGPHDIEGAASLLAAGLHVDLPPNGTNLTVVALCDARTPAYQTICTVHHANAMAYTRVQGYGFAFFQTPKDPRIGKRASTWMKIPAVYFILRRSEVQHVFWMDSDSLFMNLRLPVPLPAPGKGLMVSKHNVNGSAYKGVKTDFINAGHFSLSAHPWTFELLSNIWRTCQSPWAEGDSGVWADHDEQSAMIYVLGGARPECKHLISPQNGCLNVQSGPMFDIMPAEVMNTGVFDYRPGLTFVLHLWEFQCNLPVYYALLGEANGTDTGCILSPDKPYLMQKFVKEVQY